MATHEEIPARAAEVNMVSAYLASDHYKYIAVMKRVGVWGRDARTRINNTIYPTCSEAAKFFLFHQSSYERHKFFWWIADIYGIKPYADEQDRQRITSADTSMVGTIMAHMRSVYVTPICPDDGNGLADWANTCIFACSDFQGTPQERIVAFFQYHTPCLETLQFDRAIRGLLGREPLMWGLHGVAEYIVCHATEEVRKQFFSRIKQTHDMHDIAHLIDARVIIACGIIAASTPPCAQTVAASPAHIAGEDTATDIERLECAVCKENEKVVMVTPCNHICFCIGCANAAIDGGMHDAKCPVCRGDAKTFIKAFF